MGFLTTTFGKSVFFGLSYYLSVQLGMLFIADSVAFFWPASGVACGFFIFSDKKLWPFFVVAFIPAYLYPLIKHGAYTPIVMGLLCLANLTQSLVAGFLVQRIKPSIDINRLGSLFHFMFLSALAAPLMASLIGVPTFYFFFGYLSLFDYFLFWMVGNCAGILPVIIFMSVLVNLSKHNFSKSIRYQLERIAYCLAYVAFIYWMLATGEKETLADKIIPYFIFPCILFSSIRYGAKFTGVLTLIFAGVSAHFSALGSSPYISPQLPVIYNAISFDIFIIILTSTGLLLAALRYELTAAQDQLEEEKEEALELSRLKSQFIANMNHEIRTPVTGIVGATDLLSGSQLSSDQARLVAVVKDSCDYLLSLIANVLEFSRLENKKIDLEKVEFNLEALVHSSVKSFIHLANEKGISLYIDCQTDRVIIESDATAMQQMLSNLLTNAIKYTDSGSIIITIFEDQELKLSVEDTGSGISSEKTEKIFECFAQEDSSMNRRFGGAGLGLAIVERIVDLIPGWIAVSSVVGKGSVFTLNFQIKRRVESQKKPVKEARSVDVYSNDSVLSNILDSYLKGRVESVTLSQWHVGEHVLPKSEHVTVIHWQGLDSKRLREYCRLLTGGRYIFILPWFMEKPDCAFAEFIYAPVYTKELLELIVGESHSEEDTESYKKAVTSSKQKLRILLADDNQVNAMIIQSILEKKGCQVSAVENGSIAVKKALSSEFDLIFMDIQMPVMDGFTATREIRKLLSDIPIVALTANSNDQLVSEFKAVGMDAVLPKPIDHKLLDSILEGVSKGNLAFSAL